MWSWLIVVNALAGAPLSPLLFVKWEVAPMLLVAPNAPASVEQVRAAQAEWERHGLPHSVVVPFACDGLPMSRDTVCVAKAPPSLSLWAAGSFGCNLRDPDVTCHAALIWLVNDDDVLIHELGHVWLHHAAEDVNIMSPVMRADRVVVWADLDRAIAQAALTAPGPVGSSPTQGQTVEPKHLPLSYAETEAQRRERILAGWDAWREQQQAASEP